MLKRVSLSLAVIAALVIPVAPASAIVYGELDGKGHPYVGAYIIRDPETGLFRRICSGTLIAPDVFLTAAHCVAGADSLGIPRDETFVTFDSTVSQSSTFYEGTAFPHPDFGFSGPGGFSDPHDIAVIVLDDPVAITPAQLPTEGLLDSMRSTLRDQTFTVVGYGTIRESRKKGPQGILPNLDRRVATQSFLSISKAWLRLSMNEATQNGGACFGDSGGPHFLGDEESDLIVSLTVTGDAVCKATDVTYRIDTPSAREFLDEFVTLP